MKHLKKYNESKEKISLDDIRDICIELEDDGFLVRIAYGVDVIRINIFRGGKHFEYKDVKETILRLQDYLGDSLDRISVYRFGTMAHSKCKANEHSLLGSTNKGMKNITRKLISSLSLYFKFEDSLKKYNESTENEISIEDIRDICQELEDEGFNVKIITKYSTSAYVSIMNDKKEFYYNDVKEVVLRLKDYLDDNLSGITVTTENPIVVDMSGTIATYVIRFGCTADEDLFGITNTVKKLRTPINLTTVNLNCVLIYFKN